MRSDSLPDGWTLQALGDVASVVTSPVDKKTQPREQPVLLCNYMDVYSNEYLCAAHPYMSASATRSEILSYCLQSGDVVITKDSETPDDIAVPAVILEVPDGLVCGYHLARVRPHGMDSIFLAKQIGAHRLARYWAKEANGTTRYGLTSASLHDAPVWVAPALEQRQIAMILDAIDEAMRKTKQVIAKLQKMKQGLLQDLLTRGIDECGALRDPERHPEHFKDSVLGRIPREWEACSLGDLLRGTPTNGLYKPASYYGSFGTAIVRIDSIYDGEIQSVGALKRLRLTKREQESYVLHTGDILVNRVNSIEFVGKAAVVREHSEPLVYESNIMRVRVDDVRLLPEFANRWLGSSTCKHFFLTRAKHAIAQASVNQRDVHDVPLPLPPMNEQRAICERLSSLDAHLLLEGREREKSRLLKQGLIDDLLTGRVRVQVPEEATA